MQGHTDRTHIDFAAHGTQNNSAMGNAIQGDQLKKKMDANPFNSGKAWSKREF